MIPTLRVPRPLVVCASLAVLLPLLGAGLVRRATQRGLAPAIAKTVGEPVSLGRAELDLTGAIRLDDVKVGGTLTARSIQAGIGLGSLLDGRLGADEVRLIGPRLHGAVRGGKVDLGAIGKLIERRRARKAEATKDATAAAGPAAPRRQPPRRILAEDGEVSLDLDGHGVLEARGLELHPEAGGVRVVTGDLGVTLTTRGVTTHAHFARSAVDLALPSAVPKRAALAEGTITITGAGATLALKDAALVRLSKDGAIETRLESHAADGGTVRARVVEQAGTQAISLETPALPLDALAPAAPSWLALAGAHAAITATATRTAPDTRVNVRLDLTGAHATHPLLATVPVPVDGLVEANGTLGAGPSWDGTVTLTRGELGLEMAGTAVRRATGTIALALRLTLKKVACASLLAAIPRELRQPLDGLELSGTIAGTAELGIDRDQIEATKLAFQLALACKVEREPERADASLLLGPYEHTVPSTGRRRMAPGGNGYTPLKGLPAHVPHAFVAGEDARFYDHGGFDPIELQRSLAIDVAAGRVERGGSTISQQLVKNLWLPRERTLTRKLMEAVLTWRVEALVPKPRILEVYLNLVELGEGVHGIGPASRRWFGIEPTKLSPSQAAFLAALTPAPTSTDRRLRAAGGMDDLMRRRVRAILNSMRVNRLITTEGYNAAIGEVLHPIVAKPTP